MSYIQQYFTSESKTLQNDKVFVTCTALRRTDVGWLFSVVDMTLLG